MVCMVCIVKILRRFDILVLHRCLPPYGPLEEAPAAVARGHPVVLAARLVLADLAQHVGLGRHCGNPEIINSINMATLRVLKKFVCAAGRHLSPAYQMSKVRERVSPLIIIFRQRHDNHLLLQPQSSFVRSLCFREVISINYSSSPCRDIDVRTQLGELALTEI